MTTQIKEPSDNEVARGCAGLSIILVVTLICGLILLRGCLGCDGDNKDVGEPVAVVFDIPQLFTMNKAGAEAAYGPSQYPGEVQPGSMINFPQGGSQATFSRPYLSTIFFNSAGMVRGIMILEPPEETMDDYSSYLAMCGFHLAGSPDEDYPGRMHWQSVDGCMIDIMPDMFHGERTGTVSQLNVWMR